MSEMFKKITLIISIFLLFACSVKDDQQKKKIQIVTTIAPYEYLVSEIAGNKINVISSVPANMTPHHFEPTAKLIEKLADQDLYFRVGKYMKFEDIWLEKLKGINNELMVIDLSENIDYLDKDPHVWLSPTNLELISKNIYTALVKLFPEQKGVFKKNLYEFLKRLEKARNELRETIDSINVEAILVYHGSWAYFTQEFGINQITIEYGSREPTPQLIKSILNKVRKYNIPVIFVDPQHGSASAELIADEIKVPIELLDPLKPDILQNFSDVKNKLVKYYK